MGKPSKERTRSAESRERMRLSALARGERVAESVRGRFQTILDQIAAEVATNDGLYPENGGSLNLKEVARRVGVSESIYYKANYLGIADQVRDWLKAQDGDREPIEDRGRKSPAQREDEWKQLYSALKDSHRLSEVDLRYAQEQLKEAVEEIERLQYVISNLEARLSQLPSATVHPLKLSRTSAPSDSEDKNND